MGKGFLKHFHLGGKTKQNYLQKLKNGEKQNKYSSMPGKSIFGLGFSQKCTEYICRIIELI